MEKIKITAVSYLNTLPFVHGLKHSGFLKNIELKLDVPSVCANDLIIGKADIALVPVAVIPFLKSPQIISDYCIGAEKKVRTVCLYSNVELPLINRIFLDKHSLTSINLVKILAKKFWNIEPQWASEYDVLDAILSAFDGIVAIGDKTFELEQKYTYCFDLAEEWVKFTELPFVFACWISNQALPSSFLHDFNRALNYGIEHISEVIAEYEKSNFNNIDLASYYKSNISYAFDNSKKDGLSLFLDYLKED